MGFQAVSIMIFVVFYGCYFVKMLDQKKRGIRTDQIGRGKEGFVKFVEVTMKAAAVLAAAAGMISILIGKSRGPTSFRMLGAVVSAAGTVVFIAAVHTMRDNWRAGVPEAGQTKLVTNGIYRISRNPAFLGFDLLHIGILWTFFSWVLCGITVFAVVMYHLQIVNVEEDFLLAAFGDEYRRYQKKVCRYIGRKR